MSLFDEYLKNRSAQTEKMSDNLKKTTQSFADDRFWRPRLSKDGTGYAVVRFLPGTNPEELPWVREYSHGFQSPATGKWYIETSRTTIGEADPVSELNSKLWNSGLDSNKEIARRQRRQTKYIANVLIIKDSENPENEGQVKLYKFGQKIFNMIQSALEPEFADEDPMNPFDILEGANFKIKMKVVAGYPNYDSSEFDRPGPISKDEEVLRKIFESQHDVTEFVNPANFKSYDELKEKLRDVVGEELAEYFGDQPRMITEPAPAIPAREEKLSISEIQVEKPGDTVSTDDDDEDMDAFFKSLSN